MTDQQNGTGPDDPVTDLQPLVFLLKNDNGSLAVYQARINTAAAVYTLTVTAASPGSVQQEQEITNFLADMKAEFELATPISGGTQGPVSVNFNTEILIEPDLVEVLSGTGPGPFGIKMTLRTTVGQDSGEPVTGIFGIRGVVLRGKSHTYKASNGNALATVTANQGNGWISSPDKDIYQAGPSQSDRGRTVTVHGTTRCVYTLVGDFN